MLLLVINLAAASTPNGFSQLRKKNTNSYQIWKKAPIHIMKVSYWFPWTKELHKYLVNFQEIDQGKKKSNDKQGEETKEILREISVRHETLASVGSE